jgi:spermidine synthase
MIAFDGDLHTLEHLRYDVSSLGYQVRPQRSVVIIGAGGGRDILTAKLFGLPQIHAVEINPLVVDFVRRRFRDFSGSPYDLTGVSTNVMDGRSFVAQATARFDHIQLSAVDTSAALAAGALSLVENSLYTVEAFTDYYDHLSDSGLLSITRNWSEETQMMALRTTDLVRAAWAGRGQVDPRLHIVIVAPRDERSRWGTLLASRPPFSAAEVEHIRARATELGFAVLYAPGSTENPRAFDELLGRDRAGFLRGYPFDVAATTDDKPYFFFFEKPFSLGRSAPEPGSEQRLEWASKATPKVLRQAFVLVVTLVVVLAFLVPMLLGRLRLPAARGAGPGLLYFAAIGLGFIMVEIALIQRYGLLLGQPLWALAGVLGTILVFSGLGSLFTRSLPDARLPRALLSIVGVLLAMVLIHALAAPPALHAAMRWSLPLRVLVMLASLAPVGFVMGMPLPLGMRLMERSAPRALAWAWGVNGSLSVMGTVVAMFVSVFFGITYTMVTGGLLYLLTLPLIRRGAVTDG